MMKEQEKINGLTLRHVSQIVRRSMITRTKASKKAYNRKNSKIEY
jgi:hypothetical protein